jgi:acetolactate synthase-1/2/3 large subunit
MDMRPIAGPAIDFVALAKGMGVPARSVDNVDDFVKALADGVAEPGPRLIEVRM